MFPHSTDPIVNVYYGQIKRSIDVCLEHNCLDAAVKLIYSGIDTMAFLNMSVQQKDVIRTDFIHWVNKYIQFPCKNQLTGLDLYGARCAMLHNHSVYSQLSRQGKCRMVGYMDKSVPEVKYDPKVHKDFVLVSVPALAEAFFAGAEKFMMDLSANLSKGKIALQRLEDMVHTLPIK